MKKRFQQTGTLSLTLALCSSLSAVQAAEDVLIVYDASGSMWGQIDGVNKIVTAREVMADLVRSWPVETNLGLIAYGHRSAGDCRDIETLITPQPVDHEQFIATVNAINPKGKTPIADSLKHAADVLKYRDNNATVVLISDGLESCQGDPCAVAAELESKGVDFTAHVVGFDLDEVSNQALACIADNTGGIFVPASNATELKGALQQVQAKVEQKVPEPEPKEVTKAEVTLTATDQDGGPIIKSGLHWTVRHGVTGEILFEADEAGVASAKLSPGVHDVTVERYVDGAVAESELVMKSNDTKLTIPIVVELKASLDAPNSAAAGSHVRVIWSGPDEKDDYIGVFKPNSDNKADIHNFYTRVGNPANLKLPAEAGTYEIRYILHNSRRDLATRMIEVTGVEVNISAPTEVTMGSVFDFEWDNVVDPQDFITIVPADAKEGTRHAYIRVYDKHQSSLNAPGNPGLYELRYVLNEGLRTLARVPVEVVDSEVTLKGPDQVVNGAVFDFEWDVTINPQDFITIVPADAKEGTRHAYIRVYDKHQSSLNAPGNSGLYELRYVLNEGLRTLAHTPVEVVNADAALDSGAGLNVPTQGKVGESVSVSWSVNSEGANHRIAIAEASAADFTWLEAHQVSGNASQEFTLPDTPGRYEVRYSDLGNTAVLGRSIIEVTP
ncbi:VWA domain-containing protein [Suttonella sp. R2A3]|uniref:vWA domain-containing protein n=1 Tax=Suttonella sp. R2A3 TaxID=2908648 RepID=UPI001F47B04B|nr:VWA domain-containing protein [Suttonella sp. R2A3]UJF24874.1 VWA domain-containing protein [Suttonella sp. R2A3]